jgi:hypothetical protein
MRAVALGFEKAAAFQHKHAEHQQNESNTPPVDFFHSGKILFTFTKSNVSKRL